MRKIINQIFGIGNIFWSTFVAFKVYSWLYQEVGFELPSLNYLNIFALSLIAGLILPNNTILALELKTRTEEKESKVKGLNNIAYFISLSIALGIIYLLKIIFY